MLAHLVSLPLRSEKMFAACLVVLLAGTAGKSLAADLTPVGSLDASATGNVSSAKTGGDGSIRTGIAISGSETVADEKMLGGERSEKLLLRDAHRASVLMGTAINRAAELSLGLHGTYEHVRPEDRDQLFPEGTGDENPVTSEAEDEQSWRRDFKQTAFSGVSLMLKLKLLDAGNTQIAIAPFVESGSGETASYSLTRSVGPKAGYIAMFSYGARGVGSIDINAGYRYRNPEETGALTVRNEIFYKGLGKAYFGRDFALFVGAEGRKLMVAKEAERDSASGTLKYQGSESGEVKGGFLLTAGDFEVSASYGQRLKDTNGFGYGQSSFTAGLSMAMGNYKRARPTTSYASEIENKKERARTENTKAELKKDASGQPTTGDAIPTATGTDDYSEMIGSDIDPLEALGKEDGEDFRDMDKKINQYEADAKVESEDAKIERELREIREAEELANTEREKQEALAAEKNRLERAKKAKEEDALRQEWLQEAEQESEKVQGITNQEMDWNGLE